MLKKAEFYKSVKECPSTLAWQDLPHKSFPRKERGFTKADSSEALLLGMTIIKTTGKENG